MVRLFKRLWSPRYDLGPESIARKLAALVLTAGAAGLWHWSALLLPYAARRTEHTMADPFGTTTIYLPDSFLTGRLAALVLVVLAGYLSTLLSPLEDSAAVLRPEAPAGSDVQPPPGAHIAGAQALRSLMFLAAPLFYLAVIDLLLTGLLEHIRTNVPISWLAGAGAFAAATAMLGISAGLARSVQPPGWRRLVVLPILFCAVAVEVLVVAISSYLDLEIELALGMGALGNLIVAGLALLALSKRIDEIRNDRRQKTDAAEETANSRAG